MSYSIYQVSKDNTVVAFHQNQKAPNKIGVALTAKMKEMVIEGENIFTITTALKELYQQFKSKNIRGTASVDISYHDWSEDSIQGHILLSLSYKLNGTFCSCTEYSPAKKDNGHG